MKKVNTQEKEEKYLSFNIASQQFGIKIDQVQEVLLLKPAAQLPKLPNFLEGIIHYQDKVIPVVDLRKRFGVKKLINKDFTRIMVVKVKYELVGMIADDIHRIISIEKKRLKKPTKMFRGLDEEYIEGLASYDEESIIILNLAKILSNEEKIELFGIRDQKRSRPKRGKTKSKRKKKT